MDTLAGTLGLWPHCSGGHVSAEAGGHLRGSTYGQEFTCSTYCISLLRPKGSHCALSLTASQRVHTPCMWCELRAHVCCPCMLDLLQGRACSCNSRAKAMLAAGSQLLGRAARSAEARAMDSALLRRQEPALSGLSALCDRLRISFSILSREQLGLCSARQSARWQSLPGAETGRRWRSN